MSHSAIQYDLDVLRASLEDLRDIAAGLVAASEQPEASLDDVTRAMRQLAYDATRVHGLWQLWHESTLAASA
jgi:hypothetical protein